MKGHVAKEEWFTTQELSEEKAAFFKIIALDENVEKLTDFLEVAKGEYKGVESWGAFGLCWGGKVSLEHEMRRLKASGADTVG